MDRRVLRWFRHVKRMDEWHRLRKVKAATVEGHLGKGRPTFGWLDEVKRVLTIRRVCLQEATQLARERSVWRELMRA